MPSRHAHLRRLSARGAGFARQGLHREATEALHELAVARAEQELRDLAATVRLSAADRARLHAAITPSTPDAAP
jgi:hypothetical protein